SQRTWEGWLRPSEDLNQTPYVTEQLDTMVALMGEFHRPFGHRLGRAILAYVANYPEAEGGGRHEALTNAMADQVELRLLPKLRGVDIDQAGAAFDKLCAFVERDLGDEVLAQAIKTSVEHSEATGQFVWSGAAR
ncbi:MAG: chromosome segregation ATPase-like protein, partial [Paracoccaceae bacterium]